MMDPATVAVCEIVFEFPINAFEYGVKQRFKAYE